MNHLIDLAGVSTLATIGTAATVIACAVNPLGAGLLVAGAVMWARRNR